MDHFKRYISQIQSDLDSGQATEGTHRPALKELLESFEPSISAINEPKRIECGAPDYIIARGAVPIGYVEAKDLNTNLDDIERSDQMRRYLESLTNLILTDYLEFRWYVEGQKRHKARIAWIDPKGKLRPDRDGISAADELLDQFFAHEAPAAGTPKELASRMAAIARMVRDLIAETFRIEGEKGPFQGQLEAFREVLIADLKPEQFADMYAQTIAYGLFAARCNHEPGAPFMRQNAAFELPKTNPFLRKLYSEIAGPSPR